MIDVPHIDLVRLDIHEQPPTLNQQILYRPALPHTFAA